jgi:hypothetical protein
MAERQGVLGLGAVEWAEDGRGQMVAGYIAVLLLSILGNCYNDILEYYLNYS